MLGRYGSPANYETVIGKTSREGVEVVQPMAITKGMAMRLLLGNMGYVQSCQKTGLAWRSQLKAAAMGIRCHQC